MNERNLVRLAVSLILLVFATIPARDARAGVADKRLDVYWIDVEGGAATLIVTPAGESVLVDAGNPGGRDAGRIHRVATEVAGLARIDHLVVTHYHVDHFGGVAELTALMPVLALYENGVDSAPDEERNDPRLEAYRNAPVGRRLTVQPGMEISLRGAKGAERPRLRFLGGRQRFVTSKAAKPNEAVCQDLTEKDADTSDNANSVVLVLEHGGFRFFDAGDLTWNVEGRLVCPVDRVGTMDVYQSTHHGLDRSNNPVIVRTLQPTVVVFNNGPRKGADPDTMAAVRSASSVKAVYQVHRNVREGAPNTIDSRIANREEACAGEFVKMSVAPDGESYVVTVPSTGYTEAYKTRRR
jgi:beta-lactamase superfamily II metal-dependent hydrolase